MKVKETLVPVAKLPLPAIPHAKAGLMASVSVEKLSFTSVDLAIDPELKE